MVYYLGYFPPFSINQGLTEDEILDILEFALPCEWKKHLLVQGYESTGKDLYELSEFCEILEIDKYIYNNQN